MSDTSKQSMLNSNQTKTTPNNGLPVGVLVGIVIGCLVSLICVISINKFRYLLPFSLFLPFLSIDG